MGCYGIGVGRLAASICEAKHDDYGPIWPITIAPWEVHLCCMRPDNEDVRKVADGLYEDLQKQGVEVIYDDRTSVRAGEMFADADLIDFIFTRGMKAAGAAWIGGLTEPTRPDCHSKLPQ